MQHLIVLAIAIMVGFYATAVKPMFWLGSLSACTAAQAAANFLVGS